MYIDESVIDEFVIKAMKKHQDHRFYYDGGHFCMEVEKGETLYFDALEGMFEERLSEKCRRICIVDHNSVRRILLEINILG